MYICMVSRCKQRFFDPTSHDMNKIIHSLFGASMRDVLQR